MISRSSKGGFREEHVDGVERGQEKTALGGRDERIQGENIASCLVSRQMLGVQ